MISESHGLSKENSHEIAFVELCLMFGAINQNEFQKWLIHIVKNFDDLPTYIFNLIDIKNARDIFKGHNGPIGFDPISDLSKSEKRAVYGIAYRRGYYDINIDHDPSVSEVDAFRALRNNPHILERFLKTFPFINM